MKRDAFMYYCGEAFNLYAAIRWWVRGPVAQPPLSSFSQITILRDRQRIGDYFGFADVDGRRQLPPSEKRDRLPSTIKIKVYTIPKIVPTTIASDIFSL